MHTVANLFRIRTLLTFAVLALLAAPAMAATSVTWTLTIDGVKRQALVFAPSKAAATPLPVVFGFHGHGGKMQGAAKSMDFQDDWSGAIVVYMQGLPTPNDAFDPQGRQPGWQQAPGDQGDRDLKFFDAVLAKLHQTYSIDDKRIYVAGFSNGGRFAYLLWDTRGKELAAFAIAAGDIVPPVKVDTPRSLIEMAGKTDPRIPYDDQMQSVAAIRKLDDTGAGQACGALCTTYVAASGLKVTVLVHPGGHLYPPTASPQVVAFFQSQILP